MIKTSSEIAQELLMSGARLNKYTFLSITNSVCLAQRIKEIRDLLGWNISSGSVKGKGSLREYWLEKEEIERIKSLRV